MHRCLQREVCDCDYFKIEQYCVQRDKIQRIPCLSDVGKRVDAHSGWTLRRWEGKKHSLSFWRCSWFTLPNPAETWVHQEVLVLCREQDDTSCTNTISRLISGCDSLSSLLCWVTEALDFWEWVNLSADSSPLPLTAHLALFTSTGKNTSLVGKVTHSVLVQNQS